MNDDQMYIKKLEEENQKLRESAEKQDITLGGLIRNKLHVTKDDEGNMVIRARGNGHLSPDEFDILAKMDVNIYGISPIPILTANDIVGVQPMISRSTFADVLKTFSNSTAPVTANYTTGSNKGLIDKIAMPYITGRRLSITEIETESERLRLRDESCGA